ncbi:hypothetical protein Tco_0435408 [Tanacetum coccineum]
MLDPSLNLLVHGERLEIRDYQLCVIWKNLGYSEWSTPAGLKLARENLQSRVKEEDSITDVENAIFDLGVMDSLWPSKLCARAQSEDDMPSRTLTYMEYTRWVFCKLCGKPKVRHLIYPTKRHDFRPRSFPESFSNHSIGLPNCPLVCDDTRWRDVSDSRIKHDL